VYRKCGESMKLLVFFVFVLVNSVDWLCLCNMFGHVIVLIF